MHFMPQSVIYQFFKGQPQVQFNLQISTIHPIVYLSYNIACQETNMKLLAILLLLYCTFSAPKDLAKFTISSYILPDKKLSMELDISVPRIPDTYPVILFLTGLSGLAPSYFQSTLIDSIAEQGYAFITITKLQSPNPEKITQALQKAVDWLNQNIQLVFNSKIPGVIADIQDRFILIGHSAAGHVTTQYLNGTCGNVKLHILLDPVDGVDPFGIKKDYIITPGKFLPYATPVLVLSTQLDHVRRDIVSPPCAPANLSNERFYNAMSGPKWFLNVSKYGHIDFFNNQYRDLATIACATCKKDCVFSQYRTLVKQMILSFIDGILYSDSVSLSVIQNAKFTIPTTHKHDYMGYDPKKGGFCKRLNSDEKIEEVKIINLEQE